MNSVVFVLDKFGVPTSGFALLNDSPIYFEADMPEDADDWDGHAFRVYDLSGLVSNNDLLNGGRLLVDRLGFASESTMVLSDLFEPGKLELLKQLLRRITATNPPRRACLNFAREKRGILVADTWDLHEL